MKTRYLQQRIKFKTNGTSSETGGIQHVSKQENNLEHCVKCEQLYSKAPYLKGLFELGRQA